MQHEQGIEELENKITNVSLAQVGVYSGQPTDIAVISNSQYNRAGTCQQGRVLHPERSNSYNKDNRRREFSRDCSRNYASERSRP